MVFCRYLLCNSIWNVLIRYVYPVSVSFFAFMRSRMDTFKRNGLRLNSLFPPCSKYQHTKTSMVRVLFDRTNATHFWIISVTEYDLLQVEIQHIIYIFYSTYIIFSIINENPIISTATFVTWHRTCFLFKYAYFLWHHEYR